MVGEGFKEQRMADGGCGRVEEERGIGKGFDFGEFGEFSEHVFGKAVNRKKRKERDINKENKDYKISWIKDIYNRRTLSSNFLFVLNSKNCVWTVIISFYFNKFF